MDEIESCKAFLNFFLKIEDPHFIVGVNYAITRSSKLRVTHIRIQISMNVDFYFIGGNFSQTYAVVYPVTDKARDYFQVSAGFHSMHVNKSDLNEFLNKADREGLRFQDLA